MTLSYPPYFDQLKEIFSIQEVRETHISWALISKEYVYKIKKPLQFPFLDYSTLEKRKYYLEKEWELNRRFAPEIYLEVLKIVQEKKGISVRKLSEKGEGREYLLKMRRIPDSRFLSAQLNSLLPAEMKEIGQRIGRFFLDLPRPEEGACYGSMEQVRKNMISNLEEIRSFVPAYMAQKLFDHLYLQTASFLDSKTALLEERLKEGFIKDGHGDLRLEHVYWEDHHFGLIDCIEFNPAFRINDVISEIAFLSMELDQKGHISLSDALMEGFFEIFPQESGKRLLNLYRLYRALVRYKVTLLLLGEKILTPEEKKKKEEDLSRLADLAHGYSWNLISPQVLVICGLMGSGKSTLAKELARYYPLVHLNTDSLRKKITRTPVNKKVKVPYNTGIYTRKRRLQIYGAMKDEASRIRSLQRMVLLDGSFSQKEYWEEIQKEFSPLVIYCHAPREILIQRLQQRWQGSSVSDGRAELLKHQEEEAQFPPSHLQIDTSLPLKDNLEQIITFLDQF